MKARQISPICWCRIEVIFTTWSLMHTSVSSSAPVPVRRHCFHMRSNRRMSIHEFFRSLIWSSIMMSRK